MEIFEMIKNTLQNSTQYKCNIVEETTFEELGLDSYAVVDFALVLEEKLGITFFDEELHDVGTVKDMIAVIERHIV